MQGKTYNMNTLEEIQFAIDREEYTISQANKRLVQLRAKLSKKLIPKCMCENNTVMGQYSEIAKALARLKVLLNY